MLLLSLVVTNLIASCVFAAQAFDVVPNLPALLLSAQYYRGDTWESILDDF